MKAISLTVLASSNSTAERTGGWSGAIGRRRVFRMVPYIAIVAMLLNMIFEQAKAQDSLPSCVSIASDSDGDGFGFEFGGSCEVTSDTQGVPVVTDRQTGAEVTLQRAFWNANRDIADRDLECSYQVFDEVTGSYAEQPFAAQTRVNQLRHVYNHEPLPGTSPYIATAFTGVERTAGEVISRSPVWSMRDGIYQGPMPLDGQPWIQSVQRNGVDGAAVRIWDLDFISEGFSAFYLCYDLSGAPLAPSGSFNESLPAGDGSFDVINATGPVYERGTDPIINRATGSAVMLESAYWNITADWLGQALYCQRFEWSDSQQQYAWQNVQFDNVTYYFTSPSQSTPASGVVTREFDGVVSWYNWSLIEGKLALQPALSGEGFEIHAEVERVTIIAAAESDPYLLTESVNGIRSWLSSDAYFECLRLGRITGLGNGSLAFQLDSTDRNLIPTGSQAEVNVPTTDDIGTTGADSTPEPVSSGGGTTGASLMILCLLVLRRRL